MALIADILLIAGALGAAFYCVVLSRRLRKLTNLETGMGGAISVLSAQVTEMTDTLDRAQSAANSSSKSLGEATERAEAAAQRIELLIASLHDIPAPAQPSSPPPAAASTEPAPEAPPSDFSFAHRPRTGRQNEAAE